MKKYIILALVALLAAVLFVACDNDVKVDNNTAYTEVLESEGAFVVNGKAYDTLQSAIQAAVGGKLPGTPAPAPVVITMTRNITSRPVVIPEGADIRLDLGGYKLTFTDVETSAFSVVSDVYDQSTSFSLKNGTVALLENSNDRNVIEVKATGEVYSFVCAVLSGVTVNGNISVYGGEEGDVELWVDSETEVNGKVKAEGKTPLDPEGSPWNDANVTLYVSSKLNDVEMTNVYLDVERFGHVVLTALGGGNYIVATDPDTAISNETEEEINVYGGVCYIDREEGVSYYGSLQTALYDLEDGDVIVFRGNDTEVEATDDVVATGIPVVIDLNGKNVTVKSITADAALTIVNSNVPNMPAASATFTGNITAAGTFLVNCNVDEDVLAEGKVVINGAVTAGGLGVGAYNAEFTSDIETIGRINLKDVNFDCSDLNLASVFANKGGNISMTNCTGNVGAIVATNVAGSEPGNITIDNIDVSEILHTRVLAAADDYGETSTKFGNITVYANSADEVIVHGSVTGAVVTAGSSANNSVKQGATFRDDIFATVKADIYKSCVGIGLGDGIFAPEVVIIDSDLNLNYIRETESGTPAKSVIVTNSNGTIGSIAASDGKEESTTVITLSAGSNKLTVGQLDAGNDDIVINESTENSVTVSGAVTVANLTAKYARFNGDITATGLISISNSVIGPDEYATMTVQTSSADVDAQKAIELSDVSFTKNTDTNSDPDVSYYADVKATAGGSISLDGCSGYAGQVVSSKSVTIPSTAGDFSVLYISTKDLTVTSSATGLNAASVLITGSGESSISAGYFGNFTYEGTGTLVLEGTWSDTDEEAEFDDLNDYSLRFANINGVTENVDIKCAYIEESDPEDVLAIIRRINQDAEGQCVYINFNPGMIATLTGYQEFDMTSANICSDSSAYLNFDMDYIPETEYQISSGLVVGSGSYPSASVTFNCYNGFGRHQINLTGCIGLLSSDETVIYSTTNDSFVCKCTYSGDTPYSYFIPSPSTHIEGSVESSSLYEYRNGN